MSHPIRPRRSVLYMPGANARALDKARTLPADALILDLEDSVAPEAKALARGQVVAALRQGGYGRRELDAARRIAAAWQQARAARQGVVVAGRPVAALRAQEALRLVAVAEAIARNG